MDLKVLSPASNLPLQRIKPLLPLCAATLVLLPFCGRDAQAQNTVDQKIEALRKTVKNTSADTPDAAPQPALVPSQPPPSPPAQSAPAPAEDFLQVSMLNGIVIVGSIGEVVGEGGVPLKPGLTATNYPLLNTPEFQRLALRYLFEPLTEASMREFQRDIVLYYRRHDRPLVDVLYPPQEVVNGMIQIVVIEGRLKEVKVRDKDGNPYTNGWTSEKYLRESIHLRSNQVISQSQILNDLDWLNRNPFREVTAVYEPYKDDYGVSSVQLRVDEQRQWSADVGYENSGNPETSENRIIFGATWAKAFGLTDNQFRFAFTGDPSFEHLRVYSASYYAPLPWQHGIRLIGYYLFVESEPEPGVAATSGTGYQISMRYEIPLPRIGNYQQEASFGVDFKNQDNFLFFGGGTETNTPTEIFQLAAGYNALVPDRWGQTSFGLQGFFSPGDVTDLNTDDAFEAARPPPPKPGAKATYAYARLSIQRRTSLPGAFTWLIQGGGQVSTGELLPSEQLGMGGYATVRGYLERQGNGDSGFYVRNELRAPPFSLVSLFTKKGASLNDKLQLLGFMDYGMIWGVSDVNKAGQPIPLSTAVPFWAIGVGLRYECTRHFALRFDYGWQLEDNVILPQEGTSPLDDGGTSRADIGVVLTY
jgi:hemolysin activation/secretion protein